MKREFILLFILVIFCFSCRKAIEPLDFKSNPIDPASGVTASMVSIDSINSFQGSSGAYQIVYFHLNSSLIPTSLGIPNRIDIYRDKEFLYNRSVNSSINNYLFYVYGGSNNSEFGFIIVSSDNKKTDMQIPVKP
jgi:hypothetical protein